MRSASQHGVRGRRWLQTSLARSPYVLDSQGAKLHWLTLPLGVKDYLTWPQNKCYKRAMTGDEMMAELKRRGWSQRELARRVGVSDETVSRWRHGGHAIHPAVAAYLRDVPVTAENET